MSVLTIQPDAAAGFDANLIGGASANLNFNTEVLTTGTSLISKTLTFHRAIVSFDLSGLPGGATVNSATLTLKNNGGGGVNNNSFTANRLTQAGWVESQVTWNVWATGSNWTTEGGDHTADGQDLVVASGNTSNLVFSGLKTLVLDAIANRGGVLRLLVIGPEGGAPCFLIVNSSDATNPGDRPKVVIDYSTPVPQTRMTGNMQELIGNLGG